MGDTVGCQAFALRNELYPNYSQSLNTEQLPCKNVTFHRSSVCSICYFCAHMRVCVSLMCETLTGIVFLLRSFPTRVNILLIYVLRGMPQKYRAAWGICCCTRWNKLLFVSTCVYTFGFVMRLLFCWCLCVFWHPDCTCSIKSMPTNHIRVSHSVPSSFSYDFNYSSSVKPDIQTKVGGGGETHEKLESHLLNPNTYSRVWELNGMKWSKIDKIGRVVMVTQN